jgi:hypothetical protein
MTRNSATQLIGCGCLMVIIGAGIASLGGCLLLLAAAAGGAG